MQNITLKPQTKEITGKRYNNLLIQYFQDFQEMLSPSYGLEATTLGQIQYDTELTAGKVNNTNDGYAIIESSNYSQTNPIKEAVRLYLLDTARRVNLLVGDGTSTAMLLAIGLCKDIIYNKINSPKSKRITIEDLNTFQGYMLGFIEDMTTNKVTKKELYNYALLATRDEKIANEIATLVNQLPKGVRPTIDKDFLTLSKETVYTLYKDTFYLSSTIGLHDFFDKDRYTRTLNNVYIASTLQNISFTPERGNILFSLIDVIVNKYKNKADDYNVVLICPDMDDNIKRWCLTFNEVVMTVLSKNTIKCKHKFTLVPVLVGRNGKESNHDFNKSIYEDFEGLMGSHAFNNQQGETIELIQETDLGFAKKVEIGLKKTVIYNPTSNKVLLDNHNKKVQRILENTEDISSNAMLKEFLARKARLALSYAHVVVGGVTNAQQHNTFKLLEDGLYGACTIKESGYIPGANVILIAGLQTYNAIRAIKGLEPLHLTNMFLPTLLLCENSKMSKENLTLLDDFTTNIETGQQGTFDYVDILNGNTIDIKKAEISLASENGIIDSSQMLIEVINSVFSTVKEILKNDSFRVIEEVEVVNYDTTELIIEDEEDEKEDIVFNINVIHTPISEPILEKQSLFTKIKNLFS